MLIKLKNKRMEDFIINSDQITLINCSESSGDVLVHLAYGGPVVLSASQWKDLSDLLRRRVDTFDISVNSKVNPQD